MTRYLAFAVVVGALGCTTSKDSTNQPLITGDTCAVHVDPSSCTGDQGCMWYGFGRACPANEPNCPSGVCQGSSGSGSGSGSGSAGAGCACPNGGVCFEQIGGPAQPAGDPEIQCATPTAGDTDPCTRITGEGTCTDSTSISGLCLCDNGIR